LGLGKEAFLAVVNVKNYILGSFILLVAGIVTAQPKDTEHFYEYGPPTTIWLSQAERHLLAERAQFLDKDIREDIINAAEQSLQLKPNPADSIFYEGLVSNHPKRLSMRPHFQDITNLVNLVNAYILTNNKAFARQSINIMTAWAAKYKPTGNDVNENKLRVFYYAFDIHQSSFTSEEKDLVASWLIEIAEQQIKHWDIEFGSSNRHAKRMKLILMAGLVFDNQEYVDFAMNEIRRILNTSLYGDGSSRDLERRDALHYHNSQIKNYIILNYLTRFVGINLYEDTQSDGGSIKKSVHYMFPYIRQEKVHPEWVNTKIELDRERYRAGDEYYRPGKPWDIKQGYPTLILASPFDSECDTQIDELEKMDGLGDRRWLKFQVGIVKEILNQGR
jgi:hypothetical protein